MVSHYDKHKQKETLYENVTQEDIPALVNRFENTQALEEKLCDMNGSFLPNKKRLFWKMQELLILMT